MVNHAGVLQSRFFPAKLEAEGDDAIFNTLLMPSDFKPMLAVGAGAYEIRVRVLGEWRIIYVAKFERPVYVLHAFQKKTQKTRKEDIELAARRYRLVEE